MIVELPLMLRRLYRQPRFCVLILSVLTFAFVGVGTAVNLLNIISIRQLPIPGPDRLVSITQVDGVSLQSIPRPALVAFASAQRHFDGVCGYTNGTLRIEAQGATVRRSMEAMTSDCHQVLGVRPFLGRVLDARDDQPSSGNFGSLVVSHTFWQSALGGDPAVIGRTLTVEGKPLIVVGVTPPGFDGLTADHATDLTLSLAVLGALFGSKTEFPALRIIGRLRDDVQLSVVTSEVSAIWTTAFEAGGAARQKRAGAPRIERMDRGFSDLRTSYGAALLLLATLGGTLVLLAVVNAGSLFLARTFADQDQLRVHLAIGATRRMVVARVFLDGVALTICALLLAAPVLAWISSFIVRVIWTSSLPITLTTSPDTLVGIGLIALAIASGVAMAAPAAMLTSQLASRVDTAARRSVASGSKHWRRALTAAQVAVALALLATAGVFLRSLNTLRSIDPGYRTETLMWSRLEQVPAALPASNSRDYVRSLLAQIEAIGPASNAALSLAFPTTELRHTSVLVPVGADGSDLSPVGARVDRISPKFFSVSGVRLAEGRDFDWEDIAGRPDVAIVNRSLARKLFSEKNAIGHRIKLGAAKPQLVTIVGVAEDASPGDVRIASLPYVYRPLLQEPQFLASPILLVQSSSGTISDEQLQSALKSGHHYANRIRTIQAQLDVFTARERVLAWIAAFFATIATVVAALGLFGLLAFINATRIKELSIRLALGARSALLVRSVVQEVLTLWLVGVAVGIPAALSIGSLSQSLLFQVSPDDGVAMAGALILVLAATALASILPAHQVATVDPARGLRDQ